MPIPPFDPTTGLLPPGEHNADWAEIRDRLGWNVRRRRLLDGLRECLEVLGEAGCTRVWVNGSFVTARKRRFGGEFFPNIVEGGSGKRFAAFFQTDRDGTTKGIVVIDPTKETWE